MKKLLSILIVLIIAVGCGEVKNHRIDIVGYWRVNSFDMIGVVEIDDSKLYYYFEGVGYMAYSEYTIKNDSLFGTDFKYNIKIINEDNFKLIHSNFIGIYERITEQERNEFINEREGRIVFEEIIPIREGNN